MANDNVFRFKDNIIEPLPEASQQDAKNFTLMAIRNNLAISSNPRQPKFSFSLDEKYQETLKNYVKQTCSQSCIIEHIPYKCANCILSKSKIEPMIFNNIFIYKSPFLNQYILTKNDLAKLLDSCPSYYNNLLTIFEEQTLKQILCLLTTNNFNNFINKYFLSKYFLDYDTKLDIIQILLYPSGKILNPLIIQNLKHHIYHVVVEDTIEGNDWKKLLKNTLDPQHLPQAYLENYNERYHQPIENMLFNTSQQDFLDACFPECSAIDIQKMLDELNTIVPLQSIPQDFSIVHTIATLICNNNVSIFQIFKPTYEELIAIFYFHQKSKYASMLPIKYSPFKYSPSLNTIHYAIMIKRLEQKKVLQKTLAQYPIHANQRKALVDAINLYKEMLSLPNDCANLNRSLIESLNQCINNTPKIDNPFSTLRSTIFNMFDGNIDSVENLAKLIAKTYLGRTLIKELSELNNVPQNNLTLIYSNNLNYVSQFIYDIFSNKPFYGETNQTSTITNHTLQYLSDPANLPEFIINKLYGNTVNISVIDDRRDIPQDLTQFRKFINGTKITVDGKIYHEVSYQSSIQYIVVTNIKQAETIFSDIPHDTLVTDSCLEIAQYEQLNNYELMFLILGFINYYMDISLNNGNSKLKIATSTNLAISSKELVDEFISNFCDDNTAQISVEELNKIKEIPKSSQNKERKELGSNLQIDKLQGFAINEDIYNAFNIWLNSKYPSSKDTISIDSFISILQEKYHPLFYIKKTATNKMGIRKEYRGFCGLNIKWNVVEEFSEENKQDTNNKNKSADFTHYLEDLINKYMPQKSDYTISY